MKIGKKLKRDILALKVLVSGEGWDRMWGVWLQELLDIADKQTELLAAAKKNNYGFQLIVQERDKETERLKKVLEGKRAVLKRRFATEKQQNKRLVHLEKKLADSPKWIDGPPTEAGKYGVVGPTSWEAVNVGHPRYYQYIHRHFKIPDPPPLKKTALDCCEFGKKAFKRQGDRWVMVGESNIHSTPKSCPCGEPLPKLEESWTLKT